MKKQFLIAAVFSAVASSAQAVTFSEIGDAGSTFATAQVVTNGTTVISGFLDHTTDRFITDMFAFSVAADTTLTINADDVPTSNFGIDPVLFLMDDQRNLLIADDDSGPFTGSQITNFFLAAGNYFIAIGDFGTGAFASMQDFENGTPFADPFIAPLTGPFSDQVAVIGTDDGPFSDDESGFYNISFSEAVNAGTVPPVPLPATLPLLLAGLGGLGWVARRRSR